jgi:hypothetical protein
MSKSRVVWTREGSGYDIVYAASFGGERVATVYRGGNRWYPWSINMPGRRVGDAATLTTAKEAVEALCVETAPETETELRMAYGDR